MNKKGFTLVELLATIVVLSVIALIATPLILNVIEKAKKGALVSSVNGLIESANMYYTNEIIKGDISEDVVFDFEEGIQTSESKLSYKGKVYNGKLILTSDSDVITCIDDGKYYAYKEKASDEIISGIGTCVYDGTTGDFIIESDTELLECENENQKLENDIVNLTITGNNLQQTINEKEQAISDLTAAKEGLENQITTLESSLEAKENEITVLNGEKADLQTELTTKTNELATLNENLGKVTASASDVLSGKTILTSSGLVTGSMTNNGSISKTLNAGGSYTIPKEYHDGTGKVTANTLASQTKVDSGKTAITASQVLAGYQGWVNGNKVTGAMVNKANSTVTATTITKSGNNALITIPENEYYSTSSQISVSIDELNNNLDKKTSSNGYITTQLGTNHIDCGFKPDFVMLLVKTSSKIVPIIYNKNVSSTTYTNDNTQMPLATTSNVNSTNGLYIDDTGFYWYQSSAYQVYYFVS